MVNRQLPISGEAIFSSSFFCCCCVCYWLSTDLPAIALCCGLFRYFLSLSFLCKAVVVRDLVRNVQLSRWDLRKTIETGELQSKCELFNCRNTAMPWRSTNIRTVEIQKTLILISLNLFYDSNLKLLYSQN